MKKGQMGLEFNLALQEGSRYIACFFQLGNLVEETYEVIIGETKNFTNA